MPKAAAGGTDCFAIMLLCRLCDSGAKGDFGDPGDDFSEALLDGWLKDALSRDRRLSKVLLSSSDTFVTVGESNIL